jgi:hypothetical protein
MQFNYKFNGDTSVRNDNNSTEMSFSPDVTREPTFFNGSLNRHIPFREAISALHDIVVSDFRFKPKDKSDYKAWAAEQESIWLAEFMKTAQDASEKVNTLQKELGHIYQQKQKIMGPFNSAKSKYFQHIYKHDRDMWIVLDPVITVHPDELFFECFSKDESSYGRLSCSYEVFTKVNDFKCGTTNIDYSSALYDEFQKIRDYKETKFVVDPSGFEVQTGEQESFKETKIDVPDTWVRGFLQVNSAMVWGGAELELHPMDVYNILFHLKRKKEKEGPRSLRFILKAGQPVKILFEPWNFVLECPRSLYKGSVDTEIRMWGRRRLLMLERLIPVTKKFDVVLLGTGLPSFFIADMGDMSFTLGLSGWTTNDWSGQGNFDLLAPRIENDAMTMQKVYTTLRETWFEKTDLLANKVKLDKKVVMSSMLAFAQSGRAIYDINKKVYRIRELSREPIDGSKLRFSNEREEAARIFTDTGAVKVNSIVEVEKGNIKVTGNTTDKGKIVRSEVVVNRDQVVIAASCECNFYTQNKLYKGPCEHIVAVNMAYREKHLANKGILNLFF